MTDDTTRRSSRPDFTTLRELDFAPSSDMQATLCDLRMFHRTAAPESLLAFQYALHALAAPVSWADITERESEWTEDRHEGCATCTCRIRSVGQCGAHGCGLWIASVREAAPDYCSKRCRQRVTRKAWVESEGGRASAARAALDKSALQAIRQHPAGMSTTALRVHFKPDGLSGRDLGDVLHRLTLRRAVRHVHERDLWFAVTAPGREVGAS